MDSTFYNSYDKYFRWNNGLLSYFFSKGKKEILLYVDKYLLEEIGKKVGIEADNYKEDFISCVENFCINYNKYICPKGVPNGANKCSQSGCNYYSNIFCLKNNRRSDVLAVANHIYSKEIKYFEKYEDESGHLRISVSDKKALTNKLPFFAIVIYVVLKFDNGNTQEWKNVGEISTNSRTFIPELWNLIYQYDNRFDKEASIYDRTNSDLGDYAGRILYHLPLSSSTRNKIQDAIYKSGAWKLIDTKSFLEIVGMIMNSLKDVKANDELKDILAKCFTQNDYKGVSARKVQTVIDDFDVDEYESKITERKQTDDYKHTRTYGEFALGIYFPSNYEEAESSVVLLTTVQQQIEHNGFQIVEGRSGTYSGYNTTFVKYNNSTSVHLKEYSLIDKNKYYITAIPVEDVVFFCEYDENLYIQIREIKPSKSYIVAVRKGSEGDFCDWCEANNNKFEEWDKKDTCELFGPDWTIYYTQVKINGQYYQSTKDDNFDSASNVILMKGGIKKNSSTYFINSLPYFEVPLKYIPDHLNVYMNLNGSLYEGFSKKIVGQKLIIDIPDMPFGSNEVAYIDICIECDDKDYCFSINVSGQSIDYKEEHLYSFDRFGILNKDGVVRAFSGNHIQSRFQSGDVSCLFQINKDELSNISEDWYFTNLLAACCYSNENCEINHSKFRKCVSYAATRLGIDIQRDGFINNVKNILVKSGILNVDYSTNKCQAIPPSFIKVPFSSYQTRGTQLIMLGGCYTRAFISDLIKYCDSHNVCMYYLKSAENRDEESFLPPIILLGHNFDASLFSNETGHQCDIMIDYDFAVSLLNIFPARKEIESHFSFVKNDSSQFLSSLEPASKNNLPRIRSLRSTSYQKVYFVERQSNNFAEIKEGMRPWASIVCHQEQASPIMIIQMDTVYLPVSMSLPNYVHRSLFLMNLGMPKLTKVFICGANSTSYYSLMNKYMLQSEDRCRVLASKLSGIEDYKSSNLIRDGITTKFKMQLWKSRKNGRKITQVYLVLFEPNSREILAVAHNYSVYLSYNNSLKKIDCKTVNEGMSFLINKQWMFAAGGRTIGYSKNAGQYFEPVFKVFDEEIEFPNALNFITEPIYIQ